MVTIAQLNAGSEDEFVRAVGFVFEGSPWIARAAFAKKPFRDAGELHAAMCGVVDRADRDDQLALVRAHPDLAGRLRRAQDLTHSSHEEQRAAGLDGLSPSEAQRLAEQNAAYRARFGFPFVICAREHDAASILAEIERRLSNEPWAELQTALAEIAKIARLRIDGVVNG